MECISSSEKEVSIASGKSIEFACLALGHKVQMLDPKDDIENMKSSIMETDLVFNGLGMAEMVKMVKFRNFLNLLTFLLQDRIAFHQRFA